MTAKEQELFSQLIKNGGKGMEPEVLNRLVAGLTASQISQVLKLATDHLKALNASPLGKELS